MRLKIGTLLKEVLEEAIEGQSFIAYHGSPQKIDNFTDEFVGGDNATDQEGPGIYLTTSYSEALGYAEGGYVYQLRVTPRLLLDESEDHDLDRDLLLKLVFMASDWETHASNWAEHPEMGVEMMVDSAYEYNDNEKDVLLQIWIEAYRYDGVDFVRNCTTLGIDGLIINRENSKHIVIYNPNVIEVKDVEKVGGDLTEDVENTPMVIDIMKNPESAPHMGGRFGQDVEPKGTYVLKLVNGADSRGWLIGKAKIDKPLMIDVNDMTLIQYKRDLATEYKAKGANLTKKLMGKGYDALICRFPDGGFGEIVLFPNCSFTLT